jgi:uncharacterized protein YaiI (UPF0178 family)
VLKLYIDADACPVKDEALRVAKRHDMVVYMVSNSYLKPVFDAKVHIILVEKEPDAADNWIVDHVEDGDVVITGDILLADRCLKQNASVLGPTGKAFTSDNIGNRVASRSLSAHLREIGVASNAPGFTKQDRSRFLQTLEEMIQQIKRR